jgi:pyrroline-5-carboxylate reductase
MSVEESRTGLTEPIAVIGLGHLGEALIGGLIDSGNIDPGRLTGWDIDGLRLDTVCRERNIRRGDGVVDAVRGAGLVIVAVKPKDVGTAARAIAGEIGTATIVLSVAAGVRMSNIRSSLGENGRLARAMPNIPSSVGQGAVALCFEEGFPVEESERLTRTLDGLGLVLETEERLLDTVTGLAASGPAFVALLIEAMAEAGVSAGLAWEDSLKLTVQTFLGTACLLKDGQQDPAVFRRRVTTPAGTTIAGLRELETGSVRSALMGAVEAAVKRAGDLARVTG